MDNQEMIKKLRDLSNLYVELRLVKHRRDEAEEKMEEKIKYAKKALPPLPGVPAVMKAMPVYSDEVAEYRESQQKLAQITPLATLAVAITSVSLLIALIFHIMFFSYLAVFGGVICFLLFRSKKKLKTELSQNEEAAKSAEAYEASMEDFRQALGNYSQEVTSGIAAAKEYGQLYRTKYVPSFNHAVENIRSEFKTQGFDEEIKSIGVQIDSYNDFLPWEYHHHALRMAYLLHQGIATDFQAALEICIAEEDNEADCSHTKEE